MAIRSGEGKFEIITHTDNNGYYSANIHWHDTGIGDISLGGKRSITIEVTASVEGYHSQTITAKVSDGSPTQIPTIYLQKITPQVD